MSEKRCCVPGCERSKGLHQFPNPAKNKDRFNTWVYSVGGDILGLRNDHIFKYRRVCHKHFEEKYCCRSNRISNIAVPTKNMPDLLPSSSKEGSINASTTEPMQPTNHLTTPPKLTDPLPSPCIQGSITASTTKPMQPTNNLTTTPPESSDSDEDFHEQVDSSSNSGESPIILASKMSVGKSKGPIIEQGLCRCCGAVKRCRILNDEYDWRGQKEVYSDIFMDCFGLLLSHLDGEMWERAICATCVTRLREAHSFKQQVLKCENQLLATLINVHDNLNSEIKSEGEEVEAKDEGMENLISLEVPGPSIFEDLPKVITTDCADDIHSDPVYNDDAASMKSERKMKTRLKKKLIKSKLGKRSKVIRQYITTPRTLSKLAREDFRTTEVTARRPKVVENELKTFSNTTVIVENSYVCPFYTSFSDYYCIYCRETFTDPGKLRDHTLEHDPTSFKTIYDNKKLAQIDITRIDCRLCPTRIQDIDTLKEHLQAIHNKKLYPITNEFLKFQLTANQLTCTECNMSFKFFHALKKHMAEHFGTCICDVCGAHYFEERILLIHQKKHQKTPEEVYPCKECGKAFKSKHNRYLHEAKVHKKEAAYPCSKCDEILFTYTQRYRHLIDVHGEDRTYPCENCDRVYDSRKSLREHVRRSHLKIMKHQCDLCDRRFYLPSRLKEHMSTHTGERNYRCEYCGKSYPRLRGLKVHMQSHSTDKKYNCVLCNASFTQNVNLRNHMKRQHMGLDVDSYPGMILDVK